MAASLVGLKHSGDVHCEDGKATLSSPVARLQMSRLALLLLHVQTLISGLALLLLCSQTSNVQACIGVNPWPDSLISWQIVNSFLWG